MATATATATEMEPDWRRGFVTIRVEGSVTAERGRLLQGDAAREFPTLHRLWDFRKADLTPWSPDKAAMFSLESVQPPPGSAPLRVAALVARDVDFGIGRVFEAMAPESGAMIYKVFRDHDDAVAWLTF